MNPDNHQIYLQKMIFYSEVGEFNIAIWALCCKLGWGREKIKGNRRDRVVYACIVFHCRIKDVYLSATFGFLLLDFGFNTSNHILETTMKHYSSVNRFGGCDAFKCFQASDFYAASC